MCKAAKICIAEVEEIVEVGEIPPDQVHIPSIYVKRVVLGKQYEKRIEVNYVFKAHAKYGSIRINDIQLGTIFKAEIFKI